MNSYVRMSIDKLEGIRTDLLRTDDNWLEWDFRNLLMHCVAERNPCQPRKKQLKVNFKVHHPMISYSESSVVWPNPVSEGRFYSVNDPVLTVLVQGTEDCKSRSKCRVCDGRHHSLICEKPPRENLITTNSRLHAVKCRAMLDSESGSSSASAVKTIWVEPISPGMRQIEMTLSTTTRKMDMYNINTSSLTKI